MRQIDKKRLYQVLSEEKNSSFKKGMERFRNKRQEMESVQERVRRGGEEVLGRVLKSYRDGRILVLEIDQTEMEKATEWKETHALIVGRIESEHQMLRSELLLKKNFFCFWANDIEGHIGFLETWKDTITLPFFEFGNTPGIALVEKEVALKALGLYLEQGRIGLEIEMLIGHTRIAVESLGIELPRSFREKFVASFGNDGLEDLKEKDEKTAAMAAALAKAGDVQIATELLKMLYPRKWGKLLDRCFAGAVSSSSAQGTGVAPAPPKAAAEALWKSPTASKEFEAITALNSDVERILSFGNGEMLEIEADRAAWERLMPGEFSERKGAILSAVLAISAPAPESREGLLDALETHENGIIEAIVEVPEADEAASAYEELLEYAERFAKKGKAASEVPGVGEGIAGVGKKFEVKRPHEQLIFPGKVSEAISDAGIDERQLKITLIYGFRLSSKKAAIGGKYLPLDVVRKNAWHAMKDETEGAMEKVDEINSFLYKRGVITYYKNGDVVMLNKKGELGEHNKLDEIGQALLDSVMKWKNEFDTEGAHGKGSGNGNGNGHA